MTPTRGGVARRDADGTPESEAEARRRHDLAALAAARLESERTIWALLVALRDTGGGGAQIEALARAAHFSTGRLWQAASHANEHH